MGMKTTPARLAPLVVLLLLLCPRSAPAQPKPRAERPTYALGEEWIRSDGVFELIRVEKDRGQTGSQNTAWRVEADHMVVFLDAC